MLEKNWLNCFRKTLLGLLQEPPTHLPLVHFPLGKSTSSTNNTNPGYSNHQVIFRYVSRYSLHYPQTTVLSWIFPGFSRYKPSEKHVFFLTIRNMFSSIEVHLLSFELIESRHQGRHRTHLIDDSTTTQSWVFLLAKHGEIPWENDAKYEFKGNIWEIQGISDDIRYLQNWFKDV